MTDDYRSEGTPVQPRRINWGATASAKPEYTLIPPGKYEGTIYRAPDLAYTSSGDEQIALTSQFEVDGQMRVLTDYFYTTDKSLWRLRNFLWTIGFTEEQLSPEADWTLQDTEDASGITPGLLSLLEACVGDDVTITVYHDTYNGTKKAKIKETRGDKQAGYPPRIEAGVSEASVAAAVRANSLSDDSIPF